MDVRLEQSDNLKTLSWERSCRARHGSFPFLSGHKARLSATGGIVAPAGTKCLGATLAGGARVGSAARIAAARAACARSVTGRGAAPVPAPAPPVPAPAPAPPAPPPAPPPACAWANPIDAPASSAHMATEKIVFRMFQLRSTLCSSSEAACGCSYELTISLHPSSGTMSCSAGLMLAVGTTIR